MRTSRILTMTLTLTLVSCGNSALTPRAVAPTWAKQSLNQEPDVVLSLDVQAAKADPFFGKLLDGLWADVPRAYDPILNASRIDVFATVAQTYSAVVHGAGDPPADVVRCLWPNGPSPSGVYAPRDAHGPWLAITPRGWIVSSAQTTGDAPDAVSMDGDTLFEAWLGPLAVGDGLRRARWDAREIWSHLYAMRLQVKGGATPGFDMAARFETTVDAEHAEFDLARLERYVERLGGEADDSELTRMALEQVHAVRVTRSGVDLNVSYRATPDLTKYVLDKLSERGSKKRDARACDEDASF